jgi:hypothetical protein
MTFDPAKYGSAAAKILALCGSGPLTPMPLAIAGCTSAEAQKRLERLSPNDLFPSARAPEAAMSGLYLYFGCFEESHNFSQAINTPEGSYWHGMLHRQEPDPGNAAYWFRRVRRHPIFPALQEEAAILSSANQAGFEVSDEWDPFAFIEFCESARKKPESPAEHLAKDIQLVEWQMLFDYCAAPAALHARSPQPLVK